MITREFVENVLKEQMSIKHTNGYVAKIEDNLIQGITKDLFYQELDCGKGNELEGKFLSIASSAALAVNNFGIIKKYLNAFNFEGITQFSNAGFEKEFSTGLSGVNPQLDFYLENEKNIIGFESKFLEYYQQTIACFSESYKTLTYLDDFWFELIDKYNGQKMVLDVAQLMKHSFGIINQSKKVNKKGLLVFIYWLPINYKDIDTCKILIDQINEFTSYINKQKQIEVKTMSYFEFWNTYKNDNYLQKHIENMISRYGKIHV